MAHFLFIPDPNAADLVIDAYASLGYAAYDPFPGGSGTPIGYNALIRQFASPPDEGWITVYGDPNPALLPELQPHTTFYHALLTANEARLDYYVLNELLPQPIAVIPGSGTTTSAAGSSEISALAEQYKVDSSQVQSMFDRLAGGLFRNMEKRSGGTAGAMKDQAQALLQGAERVSWTWAHARTLLGHLTAATIPERFARYSIDQIRDAYQVARRLHRAPSAQLDANERAAIEALPNALDYRPVYVGKPTLS